MKLFYLSISPPARAALLGFRNLGLDVELIKLDLLKGEHLSQEFLKLNPAHQIPVLVEDDGFVLCESRAILGYLVNRFRPESSFYPADARKRALIDQRLYFDTLVFERNGQAIRPVFRETPQQVPQDLKNKITECMEILDGFLDNSLWFADNKNPTIADLSILSNVSQIKACGYNISKHDNLCRWYEQCKSLKGFEENEAGAKEVGDIFIKRLGKQF